MAKRKPEPQDEEEEFCEGGRAKRKRGGLAEGEHEGRRLDHRARGGHINAAQRRALPSKDFALPGKGNGPEGKGSGSYPIDTEGRARSALSRGAANASPGELATIKRKVRAKYPEIEVS